MRIFLSNIPNFIYKAYLNSDSAKKWIYFGTNQKILRKLGASLSGKAGELDYGEALYKKSRSIRSQYVKWLDEVSVNLASKREWIFSAPAVRNTYTSNHFLHVCYLEVFGELIDNNEIGLVFVDSPALAHVLENSFPGRVKRFFLNNIWEFLFYLKSFIRILLRFFRYLIDYGHRFIAAKIVFRGRRKRLINGKDSLVFIRNFITGDFSGKDDDIIERHFFPGLYNYLKEQGYTPVFLPIIVKPTNYAKLFRKVLSGDKNIVFAEEFLKLRDYFFAFFSPVRALRITIKPPLYGRYDIGRLLKEDYYLNITADGFLYATLLSCLGRRLKEAHWQPNWIINWAENQSFEKGILSGLREYFPDMKIIGGQPFLMPPNYLSPVFSKQEKLYGLLPDRVLTLGPLWKNAVTEFVEDLKTDYSPAFRYASINTAESIRTKGNDIFVLLGINLDNALYIMRILLEVKERLNSFDNILIKMHPASNFDENTLEKIIGQKFPELFRFVGGRLEQYLDHIGVGLCGASGTAVELVMKGIPVVTIGETHTLTMNYLDYKEDHDIWQICFSPDQVIKALERFRSLRERSPEELVKKAKEFCRAFIVEPANEYWENYLIR